MSAFPLLEKNIDDFFVRQTPELSANSKRVLIRYLPWLNLILGAVAASTIYAIWHWAHAASNLINYANTLSSTYGGPRINPDRLSLTILLSMILLAAEAICYFTACLGTRKRRKSGWDYMFYGLLLNLVYGVIVLFTDYGDIGNLISAAFGTAIGLYLLFQVRGNYGGTDQKSSTAKPAAGKSRRSSK